MMLLVWHTAFRTDKTRRPGWFNLAELGFLVHSVPFVPVI